MIYIKNMNLNFWKKYTKIINNNKKIKIRIEIIYYKFAKFSS